MTFSPRPDATDAERLSSIEVVICDMHARLFGNGQPGELDRIRTHVGGRLARMRRDIDTLQRWRWIERGAIAMFVVAVKFGPEIKKMLQ